MLKEVFSAGEEKTRLVKVVLFMWNPHVHKYVGSIVCFMTSQLYPLLSKFWVPVY